MTTNVQDDPYVLLGVPRGVPAEALQRAYRARARELHPDVNPSPDAARAFARLRAAYDLLSDPARRAAFDAGGAWTPDAGDEDLPSMLRRTFALDGRPTPQGEALARLAEEVGEARQAAEAGAVVGDLLAAIGTYGVEATLVPDPDDEVEDVTLKAGLAALLDYVRGGDGASPMQPRARRRPKARARRERGF